MKTPHESLIDVIKNEYTCKGACLVTNGTHAIEVALLALNLPRGSHVLIPEISFIATATAVAQCGLVPVYCDVSLDYLGLTVTSLKENLSASVSAVVLVHFAGMVNRELDLIIQFCTENMLPLVEDCAQAPKAYFEGNRVGTVGTVGTLSYQSSKLINSGEGGAILTNNNELREDCMAVSNWGYLGDGYPGKYDIVSGNYRLSNIQASYLLGQYDEMDQKYQSILTKVKEFKAVCIAEDIPFLDFKFNGKYRDCPFFFVLTKGQRNNRIEPRSQYPMSRSSMVKAIIKRFSPDLLDTYMALLPNKNKNTKSKRIINEYTFINISQVSLTDIRKTLLSEKLI